MKTGQFFTLGVGSVSSVRALKHHRSNPVIARASPLNTMTDKVTEVPRRRNKGVSCIRINCVRDELPALERVRVEGHLLHDGLSVNG